MFLVTRRPGEAFVIIDKDTGEEIIVTVLPRQDKGRGVVIGVESSKRFQIFRREMLERKQRDPDPE
jgi:sRNA-binding carbon storage regulator CsrA